MPRSATSSPACTRRASSRAYHSNRSQVGPSGTAKGVERSPRSCPQYERTCGLDWTILPSRITRIAAPIPRPVGILDAAGDATGIVVSAKRCCGRGRTIIGRALDPARFDGVQHLPDLSDRVYSRQKERRPHETDDTTSRRAVGCGRGPLSGAGRTGGRAERLARLSVAPTRPPALLRWNIGWSRVPAPGGARANGRCSWAAEPDAAHGPSENQPSRHELPGMTVPAHDATVRDDVMVATGGPGAGSILPAT